MKLIYTIIIGIFLIAGITAGAVTLSNIKDVEIKPKIVDELTEYKITYNCGKEKGEITLKEKDLDIGDIEMEMKGRCPVDATNFRWNNQKLRVNAVGDIGINDDELKEKECTGKGFIWNEKDKECKEKESDISIGEVEVIK